MNFPQPKAAAGVSKDTRMTAKEMLELCPLCNSSDLHQFSHYTSCDDGMREVKKVMCAGCQCEAPLTRWNTRTLPSSDQCVAREALEKIAVQANYAAEKLREVDISYLPGRVAGALNSGVERLWAIATVAKSALAVPQAAVAELEQCYERINCLEDALGDVLSYLEGDPQYANAKPGLIEELNALLKRGRALTNPAPTELEGE